jgi:carbamate kinase
MPLDVCVAESQGQLGYMIQQALTEALVKEGVRKVVTCILTRVVVDPDDPAFEQPTKPVGAYFNEEEVAELKSSHNWDFVLDKKRGGYRRVVPSPRPIGIVEFSGIKRLVWGEPGGGVIVSRGGIQSSRGTAPILASMRWSTKTWPLRCLRSKCRKSFS